MSGLQDIQRRIDRQTDGQTDGQGRLLWTQTGKPGVQNANHLTNGLFWLIIGNMVTSVSKPLSNVSRKNRKSKIRSLSFYSLYINP